MLAEWQEGHHCDEPMPLITGVFSSRKQVEQEKQLTQVHVEDSRRWYEVVATRSLYLNRVTTHLENLEKSANWISGQGKWEKSQEP